MDPILDRLSRQREASIFPATHEEALRRWREFLPRAGDYARLRNRVDPDHPHVSRLSVALRYRLIREEVLIDELLALHDQEAVEKLVQEIHWRTYWKGWLEQRPAVWRAWVEARDALRATAPPALARRIEQVEGGHSGVAVMDAFAQELVQTGYLHNHARMWFASFWIHVLRLPWELGADFFFRHLIDADAASNTLSWRWVAGLHTPGKTYLVRRSNLERWAAPALLADPRGLECLDDEAVSARELPADGPWPRRALPTADDIEAVPAEAALLVFDDDLGVEQTPLGLHAPSVILQLAPPAVEGEGETKVTLRARARADAARRLAAHFGREVRPVASRLELEAELCALPMRHLVTMAPFTGTLDPWWEAVQAVTTARDIRLYRCRRMHDSAHFPLARRGFFDYWKQVESGLR